VHGSPVAGSRLKQKSLGRKVKGEQIVARPHERFLVAEPLAREIFYEYHRDLLEPEFWQAKQALVRSGEQEDVFPYPEACRFKR